jgi:NAD(P)-dependent dehydrogenase (short-subunit alcohol dehydrogenase family)
MADDRLQGRVALVTGAARGIGRGIAIELARAGCRVALNDLGAAQPLADAAAEVRALGGDVMTVEADVADPGGVSTMIDAVVERFGRLDVLVNNAGVQTVGPLLDVTPADWDRVMATNAKGCFLCTQAAARHMRTRKAGVIVNIGSGCCKVPFPELAAYSASKAAIDMFTKVAAIELGPLGIRVNCVAPGAVDIERTRQEHPDYAGFWGRATPLRRVGVPQDIAQAVVFLATDAGAFITGQTLWVDGGLFSQPPWPRDPIPNR